MSPSQASETCASASSATSAKRGTLIMRASPRPVKKARDTGSFGFGRVASPEFSPAFESREESVKRVRRVATLERFGSSVATRREPEMPLTQRSNAGLSSRDAMRPNQNEPVPD